MYIHPLRHCYACTRYLAGRRVPVGPDSSITWSSDAMCPVHACVWRRWSNVFSRHTDARTSFNIGSSCGVPNNNEPVPVATGAPSGWRLENPGEAFRCALLASCVRIDRRLTVDGRIRLSDSSIATLFPPKKKRKKNRLNHQRFVHASLSRTTTWIPTPKPNHHHGNFKSHVNRCNVMCILDE